MQSNLRPTVSLLSLTFQYPWGDAFFFEEDWKDVECRVWETHHRGPLGVVLGQKEAEWARAWMEGRGFRYPTEKRDGLLIGVVTVVDVQQSSDSRWYIPTSKNSKGVVVPNFAWKLANPQLLAEPYPIKGFQGYRVLEVPSQYLEGIQL